MRTWIVRDVVISQGRHGLDYHGLTTFGHQFVDPLEIFLRESLAEVNHHRRVEWCLAGATCKAQKKLHTSILSGLLDGFRIAQAKPLLDE
jgi:hypothetical protein